jgi:Chitobiase/beta-hexosaminidase C-terminal domain
VRTPGPIERVTLELDLAGRPVDRRRDDVLFCRAVLRDARESVVPDAWENVAFGVTGVAMLIGRNPSSSEAGVASILVRIPPGQTATAVHAVAIAPVADGVRLLGASVAVRGRVPRHRLVYTTDGTEPGAGSARYRQPVDPDSRLRAGLVVQGKVVTSLAAAAPKFRIPANAPPAKREPFHRKP